MVLGARPQRGDHARAPGHPGAAAATGRDPVARARERAESRRIQRPLPGGRRSEARRPRGGGRSARRGRGRSGYQARRSHHGARARRFRRIRAAGRPRGDSRARTPDLGRGRRRAAGIPDHVRDAVSLRQAAARRVAARHRRVLRRRGCLRPDRQAPRRQGDRHLALGRQACPADSARARHRHRYPGARPGRTGKSASPTATAPTSSSTTSAAAYSRSACARSPTGAGSRP